MAAINNLQSMLNQINSPSDLSPFVDIWVYISLFFFMVHLFLSPIKTKAKLERERQEKKFMNAYREYILKWLQLAFAVSDNKKTSK